MLRRQSFKCRRPLETQRTFSLCKPQGEWQNRSGFMKISMTVIKRMHSGKVKAGRTIREWLSLSQEQKEQSENRSSEEREEIRRRDVVMKRAFKKGKEKERERWWQGKGTKQEKQQRGLGHSLYGENPTHLNNPGWCRRVCQENSRVSPGVSTPPVLDLTPFTCIIIYHHHDDLKSSSKRFNYSQHILFITMACQYVII